MNLLDRVGLSTDQVGLSTAFEFRAAAPGLPRSPQEPTRPGGLWLFVSAARLDPRVYQITVLAALLAYGMTWLALDITPRQALIVLATVLFTQLAGTVLTDLPRFDPKSALIS